MIETALEFLGLKTKQPEAPKPEPERTTITVRGQEYTRDDLLAHLGELCQAWGELTGYKDTTGRPIFGLPSLQMTTFVDGNWNFLVGIVHPVLGVVTTSMPMKEVGQLQQRIGGFLYELGANAEAMSARAGQPR